MVVDETEEAVPAAGEGRPRSSIPRKTMRGREARLAVGSVTKMGSEEG